MHSTPPQSIRDLSVRASLQEMLLEILVKGLLAPQTEIRGYIIYYTFYITYMYYIWFYLPLCLQEDTFN